MKTYMVSVSLMNGGSSGTCGAPGCKKWGHKYLSLDGHGIASMACPDHYKEAADELVKCILRTTQKRYAVTLYTARIVEYRDVIESFNFERA